MNLKVILVALGILVIIIIISYVGSSYFGNKGWYLDNRPECYLSKQEACMNGYDRVELQMTYWSVIPLYQCCLKPHYLLQTNEPTLYIMKEEFCRKVSLEPYYVETGENEKESK